MSSKPNTNPYALPQQQYIIQGEEKVPIDQYFNTHVKTMYEMLPFSNGKDAKHYTTEEKMNMAKNILDISKGENSDNMFLCGMDMASIGEQMITKASQRVYWDLLHDNRDDYTNQEYAQLLELIEEGKINQISSLMKRSRGA
jgi:GH25 family lysozyme M1 (1,4-beta-N-acetylmuramidase)